MGKKALFDSFSPISLEEWQAKASKDLKGKPVDKIDWRHFSQNTIPAYLHQAKQEDQNQLGLLPDQFPFQRSHKTLSNGWLLKEEIRFHKNLKATRKRLQTAVDNGAHHAVLAVKAYEDGFDGIPIANVVDLETLLEGVDPQQTGIGFRSGELSPFYARLLAKWVQKNGHAPNQVFGALDYDPISNWSIEGQCHKPFSTLFDELAEQLKWGQDQLPLYRLFTMHSRTFHNAGTGVIEELGLTLALAHEYIHQLQERGISVAKLHNQCQVELSVGGEYFVELAKMRAFRWLWSTMLQAYDVDSADSMAYLSARTSEWNKSVYDPYVNILRGTTEGMSAILGGADEVEIDPYDKGFRQPNALSERVARNLHHLYTHESHLDKVVDPGSGSYYVENLTHELAENAWAFFQEIENNGGYIKAMQGGFIQRKLRNDRKKREERLATRQERFVGVNVYPNPLDNATDLVQEDRERVPFAELEKIGAELNSAYEAENIQDFVLHHFAAGADKVQPIEHYVATEAFEQLRAMTEMMAAEGEKLPEVFLLPIGNKAMRAARANFAQNFYEVAGLKVHTSNGFESVTQAIEAYANAKSDYMVICGSDEEYAELIPQIGKTLRSKNLRPFLVLAGNPGDKREDFEDMGIESFIYAGCNVFKELQALLPQMPNVQNPY